MLLSLSRRLGCASVLHLKKPTSWPTTIGCYHLTTKSSNKKKKDSEVGTFPARVDYAQAFEQDLSTSDLSSHEATPGGEMVLKVLNVAEKNDAAKNIANLAANGNSSRVSGYIHAVFR